MRPLRVWEGPQGICLNGVIWGDLIKGLFKKGWEGFKETRYSEVCLRATKSEVWQTHLKGQMEEAANEPGKSDCKEMPPDRTVFWRRDIVSLQKPARRKQGLKTVTSLFFHPLVSCQCFQKSRDVEEKTESPLIETTWVNLSGCGAGWRWSLDEGKGFANRRYLVRTSVVQFMSSRL